MGGHFDTPLMVAVRADRLTELVARIYMLDLPTSGTLLVRRGIVIASFVVAVRTDRLTGLIANMHRLNFFTP